MPVPCSRLRKTITFCALEEAYDSRIINPILAHGSTEPLMGSGPATAAMIVTSPLAGWNAQWNASDPP